MFGRRTANSRWLAWGALINLIPAKAVLFLPVKKNTAFMNSQGHGPLSSE